MTVGGRDVTKVDYGDGGPIDYVLAGDGTVFIVSTADAGARRRGAQGPSRSASRTAPFPTGPDARMLRLRDGARSSPGGRLDERDDVREQLVAWAEDCRLEGEVDLDDGRLSDVVNDLDILVFSAATVVAIDDGHTVKLDELEVARRDLSLIEVAGRRGDPQRRLRTIPEHVRLEVGPFAGDRQPAPCPERASAQRPEPLVAVPPRDGGVRRDRGVDGGARRRTRSSSSIATASAPTTSCSTRRRSGSPSPPEVEAQAEAAPAHRLTASPARHRCPPGLARR